MWSRVWEAQPELEWDEQLVWGAGACLCDAAMIGNYQLAALRVGQLAVAGYTVALDSIDHHPALDRDSYI
jgi:hypothetical protein